MTIPNDVRSTEDLDDVLATIGTLGIDVLERGPQVAFGLLDEPRQASRQAAGSDEQPDLHHRRGQRRERDDAEKHLGPDAHTPSRVRAC